MQNQFSAIPAELRATQSQMAAGGIYMILNLLNGKVYIGSTVHFRNRWNKHCNELNFNRHHSRYLQFAWNKYGEDTFQFTILKFIDDKSKLELIEQEYIDAFQASNSEYGYNYGPTAGSPLGLKRSKETINKLKLAALTRAPATFETRAKMSASAKVKVFTNEHRHKMAIAQTGRKHPEEVKDKIKLANIGKPKSEEHKRKNGLAKRTPDKWPHDKGNRCTCRDCQNKKNIQEKARRLIRNSRNA